MDLQSYLFSKVWEFRKKWKIHKNTRNSLCKKTFYSICVFMTHQCHTLFFTLFFTGPILDFQHKWIFFINFNFHFIFPSFPEVNYFFLIIFIFQISQFIHPKNDMSLIFTYIYVKQIGYFKRISNTSMTFTQEKIFSFFLLNTKHKIRNRIEILN